MNDRPTSFPPASPKARHSYRRTRVLVVSAICLTFTLGSLAIGAEPPAAILESAREVPLAAEVDLVVVGGSTGAVRAAIEAAGQGASVFLAAPRPYLGDDMTATLRLWLEEGESPRDGLSRQIFDDTLAEAALPDPRRILFRYQADQPSAMPHRDTRIGTILSDLRWQEATTESVQYDNDVNVVVDLGKVRQVDEVCLRSYQRGGKGGYRVGQLTVAASDDKKAWHDEKTLANNSAAKETRLAQRLAYPVQARYLRFSVTKAPDAARLLLAEIEVLAPAPSHTPPRQKPWPRPLHVKQVLDRALLDAGVRFLFNCLATDVLEDAEGRLAGIVIANRAGRQAIRARAIVDATERGTVARLAGARFRPFPGGEQAFRRVVIGGQPRQSKGLCVRTVEPSYLGIVSKGPVKDIGRYPIFEYSFSLPINADRLTDWARADQAARSLTYDPGQQFTSDVLFLVPPDAVHAEAPFSGAAGDVSKIPLNAFRPAGMPGLYLLGGSADVPRETAARLLRPLTLIDLGRRLGAAAAAEAKTRTARGAIRVRGVAAGATARGEVREMLAGLRMPSRSSTVSQPARDLPVLGRYDVVVIGGGTAGAPAGIAAARQGAKTLVVEPLSALGGVGTAGAISNYCQGNRVGFTAEVGGGPAWQIEQKMEWWRKALLDAGAEIWFGTFGCGAVVEQDRVCGAVLATPFGRGVVFAQIVVDATGNADIAAAAGARCFVTGADEFAMQGTGLPPRDLGASYTNTDYTYTDDSDPVDVGHLLVYAKDRFPAAFDLGQLVDTRERRRIDGDYTLSILDQAGVRTFPDSIALARSSYDTHGWTVHPFTHLRHPARIAYTSYVPYRCLLPKGFEGLLVTGIALSAQRDAQPIVRMQPDIQNQGYAAGVAAAMAAKAGTLLRHLDVRALQKHLVAVGNLPEKVLEDRDSFPRPAAEVVAAVGKCLATHRDLAIVLAHPAAALPALREAWKQATGEEKLAYAKILATLGDASGLPTLIDELDRATEWDAVPDWQMARGEFQPYQVGWSLSRLDTIVIAVGRTGRRESLPAVLKMTGRLGPNSAASHYRAVCLALERLGDASAAPMLAKLLGQDGINGHAVTSAANRPRTDRTLSAAVRELGLARALYRCGDWKGKAESILKQYTQDLRGHFARHASAVLAAGKDYRPPESW